GVPVGTRAGSQVGDALPRSGVRPQGRTGVVLGDHRARSDTGGAVAAGVVFAGVVSAAAAVAGAVAAGSAP
ncbi:MAG: hypothetical protein M3066_10895, partial [Actinomycetota bacterium]|nr:hypothetical protein [Actinomycetota bacterium]